MEKGNLVVYKTHPYFKDKIGFKISGYTDYTSPILNIIEVKNNKYDPETGNSLGNHLHCIYYDSKNGKFIKRWINSKLTTEITYKENQNPFFSTIVLTSGASEISLKKEINLSYLNRKVSLKSVDIELQKKKINREFKKGELIETNHLEFLPPIMTIIGYRFIDDKKKYCEETGEFNLEFKCKWYNSSTKSFSEEFIHYKALYLIKETSELTEDTDPLTDALESINSNKLIKIKLENYLKLEGLNPGITIKNTLVEPKDVFFNHYYYKLQYIDYCSQKNEAIIIKNKFEYYDPIEVWGQIYPSYDSKNRRLNIYDCKFNSGEYFYITYIDQFERRTKRIIRVSELLIFVNDFYNLDEDIQETLRDKGEDYIELNEEILSEIKKLNKEKIHEFFNCQKLSIMIKANCLLRNGEIRHFRFDRVLRVREIINGEEIFENNIV